MPTMTRAGYTPPNAKTPKGKPPRGGLPGKKKKRSPGAVTLISLAIFAVAVLIGATTLYLYVETSPWQDAFAPGTSFEGVKLTGYSYEDGETIVRQMTAERVENWRFEIDYQGTQYVLTAQDVALHVDERAALDPLWQRAKGNRIAAWLDLLTLRAQPQDTQATAAYDMTVADALLQTLRSDVEREPVDACVTFTPGDSEPFRFEEESVGLVLHTAPLREAIETSLRAMVPGQAQAEPEEIAPSVFARDLRAATVLRAHVILTLLQDEAADQNAALAAVALNGLSIGEGESFSLNAAVGKRSAARGYVSAAEPAYGENIEGVGGGVCQTATALYQLALLGDVKVTERHAGAQTVSYAQPGQEATVSDQGLDLVLQNDTGMPLYLTARVYESDGERYLLMDLIGAPLSERHALQSSTQVIPAPQEPIYVRDSEGKYATYTDERVPVIEAKDGLRSAVYLVTLNEDGQILSRELVGEDEYPATQQAIYVGIKQREE